MNKTIRTTAEQCKRFVKFSQFKHSRSMPIYPETLTKDMGPSDSLAYQFLRINSLAYLVRSPVSADMLRGQPNKYVIRRGNNPPACSPIAHSYPLVASPFVIS